MTREFKPAGFEQPEGSRRDYIKPRAELQEAFDNWIKQKTYILGTDAAEVIYKRICEQINHLGEISYKEANSLLVDFNPKTYEQRDAGLFISACYEQSPEQVIIFDLDMPNINFIGYNIERNGSIEILQ